MRNLVTATGLALIFSTPGMAAQTAPGAVTGGGDQPLLLKSTEPDLSTDPASIDELRHKIQKDRKNKRSARSSADDARPAQATEITAGKPIHDITGQIIAAVEQIAADGVVVRSGATLVKVPLEGFGVNKKGLLLNLTKPQFDQLIVNAGAATPRS